jgi:putative phage-type endonuclease
MMDPIIEQRSAEWRQQRAGKITASCFADVISVRRDGNAKAARQKLMHQLAFERLAGIPRHEVGSKSMDWGTDLEAHAREAYEIETGNIVVESEFLLHPLHQCIGASPDGLVGTDGGIEMKCPHDEAVHIQTWLEGMPENHIPQVQGNMLVTGRSWWDFVSYDPRQGQKWRLYIQRIPRDDDYINNKLLPGLLQFEAELQAMVGTLRRKAA